MSIYYITLYTPDNRMVRIDFDGSDARTILAGGSVLSGNETTAVSVATEIVRCLNTGKPIDRHFAPMEDDAVGQQLMRCMWKRNGALEIVSDREVRKYNHASTVTEALERRRVFTCVRSLYNRLPTSRGS